ncbi:MAG: RuBisCO accumulation factor 1 [Oculatellaceae cyanobacterium bins.114]|nr:RuBisCO accumulation factor 1 [Oculatellaceae cyanobacterium bins.114]
MTITPPDNFNPHPDESNIDVEDLLRSLRRKEGTWHNWGQACQQLQKVGYNPQQIFEATGFEPIQQNQIVVAAQVYESIQKSGVSTSVQDRFERTGSDSLYELRILNQGDRAAAAELLVEKGIDSEGAKEVAKALKDFSRLSNPPAEFASPPGDAVAYHYWRLARQQSDLQMRSRLIAMALRFANSESARRQVEQLLTDFTVSQTKKAPTLPIYRLESESELPRILPVVGKLPLTISDLQAVPLLEEEGAFRLVKFSGTGAWVPVPGWQVVFSAEDPVVILADSDQLPHSLPGAVEEVLVMIDRAQREWDDLSYFVIEQEGQLQFQWFAEPSNVQLLGRVLVVLRPKKVLDEDFNKELWQIEE